MKALVYTAAERYQVTRVPDPTPGPSQVVVRVARCGVCKTDLHIHHGRFLSAFPLTPGHEFCGEIVDTGRDVGEWRRGDRVACDNTILCGHCYYCRRNQPLYCEHLQSLGCTTAGGLAELVVINADKAFRIPGGMSYDEAMFTEPLACVVHGADTIAVAPGDRVLVFGAGPAGMLLSQLLASCGASLVVVVGSTPFKLERLQRLGIAHTVLMDRTDYTVHARRVRALAPEGYDVVVEATGFAPMLEHAFEFTRMGAKVIVYGVYDEEDRISVRPYWLFRNEIRLIGSFAQTHCFERSLRFLGQQRVRTEGMITHRLGLEDYGQALELLAKGQQSIKIAMHPNG